MWIIGGMGSVSGVIYGVIVNKLLQQLATKLGPFLADVMNLRRLLGFGIVLPSVAIILFLIFALAVFPTSGSVCGELLSGVAVSVVIPDPETENQSLQGEVRRSA